MVVSQRTVRLSRVWIELNRSRVVDAAPHLFEKYFIIDEWFFFNSDALIARAS